MSNLTGAERTARGLAFIQQLLETSKGGDSLSKLTNALDEAAANDLLETTANLEALDITVELLLLGMQVRGAAQQVLPSYTRAHTINEAITEESVS